MPSVASDLPPVVPSRQNLPNTRSATDARDGSSPFAEMLDAAEPPPQRADSRSRTDRSERSESSRPASARDTDTAPPKPRTERADQPNDEPVAADDLAKPADTAEAKHADGEQSEVADASVAADQKVAEVAEIAADATQPAPAPPQPVKPAETAPPSVTIPAAPTAATNADSGADGEVAIVIAAAGQRPAAAKAEPAKSDAQGAAAAKPAEGKTEEKTAVPPVEADTQAKGDKPEKASTEVRKPAVDAAPKPDTDAAAPRTTESAAAATKASADAMQPLAPLHASHAPHGSAPVAPAHAGGQAQAANVPLAGVAVEIATQAAAGKNRFEIRLDPPELGRIDVRLEVDRDGNVTSKLVVERAETLDLLRRDQTQLERALQQAGLKTSDNALEFSLRQQQSSGRDDQSAQSGPHLTAPDDEPLPPETVRQNYGRLAGLGGGLDIRV